MRHQLPPRLRPRIVDGRLDDVEVLGIAGVGEDEEPPGLLASVKRSKSRCSAPCGRTRLSTLRGPGTPISVCGKTAPSSMLGPLFRGGGRQRNAYPLPPDEGIVFRRCGLLASRARLVIVSGDDDTGRRQGADFVRGEATFLEDLLGVLARADGGVHAHGRGGLGEEGDRAVGGDRAPQRVVDLIDVAVGNRLRVVPDRLVVLDDGAGNVGLAQGV